MNADKRTLLLPILLITVGCGWLLSNLGVTPDINWLWTLGLAVVGVLAFALGGVDKFTVVVGPFFIFASILSILRQSGRLDVNIEIPVLVITAGALMLIARVPAIPVPRWIIPIPKSAPQKAEE